VIYVVVIGLLFVLATVIVVLLARPKPEPPVESGLIFPFAMGERF
jgi:hypothetical protein